MPRQKRRRVGLAMLSAQLTAMDLRLEAKFEAIDVRFDAMDRRLDAMDRRFDAMDGRLRALERGFVQLDAKINDAVYVLRGEMRAGFAEVDGRLVTIEGTLVKIDRRLVKIEHTLTAPEGEFSSVKSAVLELAASRRAHENRIERLEEITAPLAASTAKK